MYISNGVRCLGDNLSRIKANAEPYLLSSLHVGCRGENEVGQDSLSGDQKPPLGHTSPKTLRH
jgi:hypothetical protein